MYTYIQNVTFKTHHERKDMNLKQRRNSKMQEFKAQHTLSAKHIRPKSIFITTGAQKLTPNMGHWWERKNASFIHISKQEHVITDLQQETLPH
jgi:hypothetical protein